MIEVSAKVVREPVVIAGDFVECVVTFRNTADPDDGPITKDNLAWASAQIHCHCSVDEKKIKMGRKVFSHEQIASGSKETSFIPLQGEKGYVVYSSKPRILFCDLNLLPGESKSFLYLENLPLAIPPTYRGQAIRYAYKITIGLQRINAPIKTLRIPLRVMVVPFLADVLERQEEGNVAPKNPFLPAPAKPSVLYLAMEHLQNLTAGRRPNYYNVIHQNKRVARFCLLKHAYRLGEDIVGTFDFSGAVTPCVQFSVSLESEERCVQTGDTFVTSHGKQHAFCLQLKTTHIAIPIPALVTPTFASENIELNWRLHFEFVLTTTEIPPLPEQQPDTDVIWEAPNELEVQTMIWDLPIELYATHPRFVSQHLLAVVPIEQQNASIAV